MRGRVLVVAGSDSGGGAGLQADIKTITALGGYAATAVTALTAQNTLGVHEIQEVPVEFVETQMRVVLGDIGADAIKCGMLHRSELIERIAGIISDLPKALVFVLDPVMYAKGGAALLQPTAIGALKTELIPLADLITPNVPEAEALLGHSIPDTKAMLDAALELLGLGPGAVLLKGGHMDGSTVTDILAYDSGSCSYSSPRLQTKNTHGTGCTLASAATVGLAQELSLVAAVKRARRYVFGAIENAPEFGAGHGPLNHSHDFFD